MEQKLKKVEVAIKKAEQAKIEASVNLRNARAEYKNLITELEAYGLPANADMATLEKFIAKKEEELQKKMSELETLLPEDVLNKYSEKSIDELLNEKTIDEMNLIQEF